MVAVAILLSLGGLLIGYVCKDFTWFARFGALLSRASLIRQDIMTHVLQSETGLSHLNPEHYKQIGEPVPDWVHEDHQTRAAVGVWGPLVSFIGTLIWGFGDLLNRLL
jgi:hypothetical protein